MSKLKESLKEGFINAVVIIVIALALIFGSRQVQNNMNREFNKKFGWTTADVMQWLNKNFYYKE